jgi:hypothetical protein
MNDTNKKFKVLCPVQNKDGKTFWVRMGIGYPNQDGSTNIYLDGLPVNGKLQLREWDEPSRTENRSQTPTPNETTLPF